MKDILGVQPKVWISKTLNPFIPPYFVWRNKRIFFSHCNQSPASMNTHSKTVVFLEWNSQSTQMFSTTNMYNNDTKSRNAIVQARQIVQLVPITVNLAQIIRCTNHLHR
jgi:hypothetical protein